MDAMTRHPVILLRGLRKTYATDAGEVQAVKGVDLTVNAGDFVAIMGSSGSGKSTMMNILGCLDQASEGSYLLDGVDTSHLDTDELAELRNRKLGFVFQGFNLLSRTTAQENVELPLIYSPRRLSPDERADGAVLELERVGLGERLDHHPNELSGGQQQRVAIARALVHDPRLVICDEPTSALDRETGHSVMGLLKEVARKADRSVIVVTHDPRVYDFADRIAEMEDGRILTNQLASPETLHALHG